MTDIRQVYNADNLTEAQRLEPFKLGRDANWVLHVIFHSIFIPVALYGNPAAWFFVVPVGIFSCLTLYCVFVKDGDYGVYEGRLRGMSFMERIKIGLIWE